MRTLVPHYDIGERVLVQLTRDGSAYIMIEALVVVHRPENKGYLVQPTDPELIPDQETWLFFKNMGWDDGVGLIGSSYGEIARMNRTHTTKEMS